MRGPTYATPVISSVNTTQLKHFLRRQHLRMILKTMYYLKAVGGSKLGKTRETYFICIIIKALRMLYNSDVHAFSLVLSDAEQKS